MLRLILAYLFQTLSHLMFHLSKLLILQLKVSLMPPAILLFDNVQANCLGNYYDYGILPALNCPSPVEKECFCRTDLIPTATSALKYCITAPCSISDTVDVLEAIACYTDYCDAATDNILSQQVATTRTQGSSPTNGGSSNTGGSSGSSSTSNNIALGTGIGIGVPACIAAIIGAYYGYRAIHHRAESSIPIHPQMR